MNIPVERAEESHLYITLKNKKLPRTIKACRDIPGKELFQYFNEEGDRCSIDSGMVNEYKKEDCL